MDPQSDVSTVRACGRERDRERTEHPTLSLLSSVHPSLFKVRQTVVTPHDAPSFLLARMEALPARVPLSTPPCLFHASERIL